MRKNNLPTKSQLKWADSELGVIIHLDMQVFEPEYRFRDSWGYTPPVEKFNPVKLDTDQWLETAASAGAEYAVLVAKHCSGFSLWPTRAHSYHVGNSPWKRGKGDIVGDFINSCGKYGIKPGLYCSASVNAFMNVDKSGHVRSGNESEQKNYNNVVESQLTELWSNYGDIFEIWFDGGVLPPESGGPEIIPLLEKYQPEAVVFQGPESWPSLIRWCGNERGEASYPCWSRTDTITSEDGTSEKRFTGSPNAEIWAPAEADMPNRDQKKAFMGGWFWRKGDEQYLYSSEHLKECYFSSVGRNANMLLGMVISPDGLVPRADVRQYAEFGEKIRNIYKNCMGKTAGDGNVQRLKVSPENKINMLLLMENIKSGEKVRAFTIEAKRNNKSEVIAVGSCIGHKRLIRIPEISAEELTLRITDCENDADIKEFSVWRIR